MSGIVPARQAAIASSTGRTHTVVPASMAEPSPAGTPRRSSRVATARKWTFSSVTPGLGNDAAPSGATSPTRARTPASSWHSATARRAIPVRPVSSGSSIPATISASRP
jgi:hypothetical protein